jgi:aspartyl-tRNA(Asn)/glutamyl-tRNA(Gln) amidotransferase subunit A
LARNDGSFKSQAGRRRIHLGRPKEHFWLNLEDEVRRLTEKAVANFAESAATVAEISLPLIAEGVEAANLIAAVQATRVHECAGYFPSRASQYGADVRGRLEQGGKTRAVDYLKAEDLVRRAGQELEQSLDTVDAIVIPTAAVTAPPIGSELVRVGEFERPLRSALVDLNRPGNFTGLPAVSVPCGLTESGLPVALQFIGRRLEEARLIAIASRFAETLGSSTRSHPLLD